MFAALQIKRRLKFITSKLLKMRLIIFSAYFFLSCSIAPKEKIIIVQPLGDFPQKISEKVFAQLKKCNPSTFLRANIAFPKNAYYEPRNRYRADSLIRFLNSKVGRDTIIIGLSSKDISITKDKVKDWGVMGYSNCPGKACIVSNFRLKTKNKNEQFYKVVLHEIGHTQGLKHCAEKSCFMRDAKGKNYLDEEKYFCARCKTFLETKNLRLR